MELSKTYLIMLTQESRNLEIEILILRLTTNHLGHRELIPIEVETSGFFLGLAIECLDGLNSKINIVHLLQELAGGRRRFRPEFFFLLGSQASSVRSSEFGIEQEVQDDRFDFGLKLRPADRGWLRYPPREGGQRTIHDFGM